ncbi:MAG TPA: Ig-like domain-containing protein [Candidatus Saccharimonadales bacterium]|nr:Ig-like domain-containing protein [Candidatus Saccharimonadales bacterium]
MTIIGKIIDWIKLHKKLSLLVFSVLFFLGFLYLVFGRGGSQTAVIVSPTPTATPNVLSPDLTPLTLVSVNPQAGIVEMGGTESSISLFFSTPIDTNTVIVDISPSVNPRVVVLADFPNRILLVPQTSWQTGTDYTIRVFAGLKSADGKKQLKQDIVVKYSIKALPPLNKIE